MTEQEELLQLFYSVLKKMKKEWSNQIQGINRSQYLILHHLSQAGPQKAAHLAEVTQTTPGAITSATDKLVAEGYAQRKVDEEDRRVVYLEITEKGRVLVDALTQEQNNVTKRVFQRLPQEDIRHLIRIYRIISDNLDQQP